MSDKNQMNLPSILQPRDGTAEALQSELNSLYGKHQKIIAEIDDAFKKRVTQLVGSDDSVVDNELYRDIVTDYAAQMSEEAARYYASSRELWSFASDVELDDYKESIVHADRGLYDALHGYSRTDFNGLTWKQVYTGRNRARLTIDDMWGRAVAQFDHNDSSQWVNLAYDVAHRTSRLTTLFTAKKDPSKVRYARVPQGITCEWCVMIASRGFVYHTEDTAGDSSKFHLHDDCLIIPSWGEQSIPGYDPDSLYKQYAKCRDAVEQYASSDHYHRWVLEQPSGSKIPRYNVWKRNQILAEMRTRDREWLNTGKIPTIEYESEFVRERVKDEELLTALRLSKNGIKCIFQQDWKEDANGRRIGKADLVGGIEIKTLSKATTRNTIESHLGNASKKIDATAVVFDNSDNTHSMSDDDLKHYLTITVKFHNRKIYMIDSLENLVRIK